MVQRGGIELSLVYLINDEKLKIALSCVTNIGGKGEDAGDPPYHCRPPVPF
jgi:hypothetical protein